MRAFLSCTVILLSIAGCLGPQPSPGADSPQTSEPGTTDKAAGPTTTSSAGDQDPDDPTEDDKQASPAPQAVRINESADVEGTFRKAWNWTVHPEAKRVLVSVDIQVHSTTDAQIGNMAFNLTHEGPFGTTYQSDSTGTGARINTPIANIVAGGHSEYHHDQNATHNDAGSYTLHLFTPSGLVGRGGYFHGSYAVVVNVEY